MEMRMGKQKCFPVELNLATYQISSMIIAVNGMPKQVVVNPLIILSTKYKYEICTTWELLDLGKMLEPIKCNNTWALTGIPSIVNS